MGNSSIQQQDPVRIQIIQKNCEKNLNDQGTFDRVSDGTKRCRICKEVKNLAEFRMINSKEKSYPCYACNPCSRKVKRLAYQHKKRPTQRG